MSVEEVLEFLPGSRLISFGDFNYELFSGVHWIGCMCSLCIDVRSHRSWSSALKSIRSKYEAEAIVS